MDEFIKRIENRIKQKKGILIEYEKAYIKLRKEIKSGKAKPNNETFIAVSEKVSELIGVIAELENVKDIYLKLKGGLS